MRRVVALLFATALIASCSSGDDASPASSAPTTEASTTVASTAAPTTVADTVAPETTEAAPPVDFTARPFEVFTPSSYDEATPMPLVVLLHGFGASGDIQEAYFQLQPLAEERGFLYVHPDGTVNQIGRQFWNATDACCGFATTIDDSGYLLALIEQVEADYNVDPRRIYLVGHSNGGFMSYRMACDHADKIAAIASLAGATFADVEDCDPSEPVSVLQIHGTADETIPYTGGTILGNDHPSAQTTVDTWAGYNECAATTVDAAAALDLDANLAGAETSTEVFEDCPTGIGVELWTIDGGAHIPARTTDMSIGIIDFLFAHPKP
ncbi:MAG: alpha/beta fold hydrolase [Ilumatobacteraceae bacterium]